MKDFSTSTGERNEITRIRPLYLGPALGEARRSATTDAERRAISKAIPELLGGTRWSYDVDLKLLTVESCSRPGIEYWTSHGECSCPAGMAQKTCWHVAALVLVRRAVELEYQGAYVVDYEQQLSEMGGF